MEDSYTVHRRRKAAAAARKREKTPEPSARARMLEASEDEEEAARRVRMERMAEDAEQLGEENRMKLEVKQEPENKKRERKSPVVEQEAKKQEVVDARENDAGDDASGRSIKRENAAKPNEPPPGNQESAGENVRQERPQEAPPRPKEADDVADAADAAAAKTAKAANAAEPRKAERRLKKKSKERLERQSRSTDSSDMDDRSERSPRRTKSPEGTRIRTKKTVTRTRVTAESEIVRKEATEKPTRERRHSKKLEDAEDSPKEKAERRHSTRQSHTDDTDEERKMRKSETFPRESTEEPVMKRSATDVKKQIIPLSNDSLIQDFAKAQREYLLRERSILDPEPDQFEDAREEQVLRKRKTTEDEQERTVQAAGEQTKSPAEQPGPKRSWLSWIPFLGRKKEQPPPKEKEEKEEKEKPPTTPKVVEVQKLPGEKVTLIDFFRALKDVAAEFKAFVEQNPRETRVMRLLRNRCASELLALIIYCGLGAFVFRFVEGAFETFYKCGVKRVKRDFLDSLWNYSHNLREEDWKSMARRKLMEFEEQLHTAHEAGVHSYSGQRSWSFLNAVVYCLTVVTTIGYGHISPSTTTGRAITIVYAIFGIPMFLIVLADFGKLFTRGIKFLWAFVRRLYYTGSCRKVRRTVPVQEVMKGVQLVYDLATFRRPSQMNPEDIEEMQRQAQQTQQPQTVLNLDGNVPPDTPGTPAMSAFAIDDEFNLPISVAIFILLGYIFIGATLYYMWEDWGFFESFYFVFISMSTIGFGDYVPKHPIYMMCSIIYLVFGLALTSMCINVVQVMLSDSFKQASQKIGATIGFEIAEDDGSVKPSAPPLVEMPDVHTPIKESESVEKIAPRAKQEDVDL